MWWLLYIIDPKDYRKALVVMLVLILLGCGIGLIAYGIQGKGTACRTKTEKTGVDTPKQQNANKRLKTYEYEKGH